MAELTPEQDAKYRDLNARYRAVFGANNFSDFDYNAYLNDSKYSQNIWSQATQGDQQQQRQQAISDLVSFFRESKNPTYQKIDSKPFFDPMRGQIDQFAASSTQNAQARINDLSKNAEGRLTESLAGTGLGRSGVAQGAFSSIGETRISQMEEAARQISERRDQQQLQLQMKEMEFQLNEELLERGYTIDQANQALAFQRQLWGVQFGVDLENQQKDWMDTWGPIIEAGLGAAGTIIGGAVGGPVGATIGNKVGGSILNYDGGDDSYA